MTRDEQLAYAIERHCAQWLARLAPDGGLWSWKSSPHVLWLAAVLMGHEYPMEEAHG